MSGTKRTNSSSKPVNGYNYFSMTALREVLENDYRQGILQWQFGDNCVAIQDMSIEQLEDAYKQVIKKLELRLSDPEFITYSFWKEVLKKELYGED